MPEWKGVLNITDEHLRGWHAKAKRFTSELSSATSQKFREQRNRAPFRRSAPGPILCLSLALPAWPRTKLRVSIFQRLKCAFAQLYNFSCSQLALSQRLCSGRREAVFKACPRL